MAQQQVSTNTFGCAKWIVSSDATQGTHTTIATALTAASSGDTIFIRPGTYTENLTLKAGVNLSAFVCDAQTPNVTIVGKCSFSSAGTVTISGVRLQTNSDNFLAVTGSAASIVNLENCYLNCSNNTGISFTSSSSSANILMLYCKGNITTTGIALFASSSAGTIKFSFCDIANDGNSTTASTVSAGTLFVNWSQLLNPVTTSSTASFGSYNSSFSGPNATALTCGGSGSHSSYHDVYAGGTASAISVGGSLQLCGATINSSNTNAITGAGSITYSDLVFTGSSSTINTTTQAFVRSTNFQSVNIQTFTGNGTYTPTAGMKYCIIECVGGGGGGGGTATSTTGFCNGSGGGGGGGYARKLATAATIGTSQSVTIGTAGTAGTAGNNAGGNGGDTSVGSLCIGKGGTGGNGGPGTNLSASGGAGGVAGTGDFTIPGQAGQPAVVISTGQGVFYAAGGGNSFLGYGGATKNLVSGANLTGNAGQNYGGGGGGAVSYNNGGTQAGAAGAAGVVIITEYIG